MLPRFPLLHAANSFSFPDSGPVCIRSVRSSFHHASITPSTASLAYPLPQTSGCRPYPIDGAGKREFTPTVPMTLWVVSSALIMAKWNCRPQAPEASGVWKLLLAMWASVSSMDLWGIFGQLDNVVRTEIDNPRHEMFGDSTRTYSQSATSCRDRYSNICAASLTLKGRK